MQYKSPSQDKVLAFTNQHGLEIDLRDRVLDLVSEVGELAKEVLSGSAYGQQPFSPTENWPSELGDIYFALLCLANSSQVDLQVALDAVIQKYEVRLKKVGHLGSEATQQTL